MTSASGLNFDSFRVSIHLVWRTVFEYSERAKGSPEFPFLYSDNFRKVLS